MKMEDVNETNPETPATPQGVQSDEQQALDEIARLRDLANSTQIDKTGQTVMVDANYHEVKGLPSKYKLYPEGTVIKARPLKVIEVKKLSSINEHNADGIINDILRRTVIGIDVDELVLADKLFIVFWLRANTYRDSAYVVDFVCPKCERKSRYHYELENLNVNFLSDSYDASDITLKISGNKVGLRFLKVSDEAAIERFKDVNSDTINDIDDELLGLASMITHVDGNEGHLLDKYNYILNLDPGDYVQLTSVVEKNAMGVEPWLNVKCEECGGMAQIGISFRSEFFIPNYKV